MPPIKQNKPRGSAVAVAVEFVAAVPRSGGAVEFAFDNADLLLVRFPCHGLKAVRRDFRRRKIAIEVAFARVAAGSVSSNRAAFHFAREDRIAHWAESY
jgi:hypothetical protein